MTRKSKRRMSSEYRPAGEAAAEEEGRGQAERVRSVEDRAAAALRALRQHLELGETEAALAVYQKARRSPTGWQPPEPDWRDLIEALLRHQFWDDAVLVMRDYLRELPEPSPRVRLKLAQVLIQKHGPAAAGAQGPRPDPRGFPAREARGHAVAARPPCRGMREEGPLELDEDLV